jgi:hypothetical protein
LTFFALNSFATVAASKLPRAYFTRPGTLHPTSLLWSSIATATLAFTSLSG